MLIRCLLTFHASLAIHMLQFEQCILFSETPRGTRLQPITITVNQSLGDLLKR